MRAFWEQVGILDSVYRLVGRGLSDAAIAEELGIAEVRVRDCVAWTVHFLGFSERNELVRYSSSGSIGMGMPAVADAGHIWPDQAQIIRVA